MKYSIILPVYNESENLQQLYERISKVMAKLKSSYEVVFINDGSTDRTGEMLVALHKKDSVVKIINFSRNFGHQTAVSAGLKYCTGDMVAILDSDLQDPPEVLPDFFKKLESGYDTVYAVRKNRKETAWKKFAYSSYYRILKALANYVILAGSVQGPQKRQILITPAMRATKKQAKKNYELLSLEGER